MNTSPIKEHCPKCEANIDVKCDFDDKKDDPKRFHAGRIFLAVLKSLTTFTP